MDAQAVIERLKPIVRENLIPIILAFFGLIFFAYGLISLFGGSRSSSSLNFEPARENIASEAAVKNIVVDIEGAVTKPGVYKLSVDSRVADALVAASGLSAEADRKWTEKNLNLAAKLIDGSKIYIPRIDEVSIPGNSSFGIATFGNNSFLININTASLSELDTLKGIGLVTAQKIIDDRPYSSINDLVSKKAVTQKVFEGIKEKISVN